MTRNDTLLKALPLLRAQARRRTRHSHDREDLAQDAAVRLLEQHEKYDQVHLAKFCSWQASRAGSALRRRQVRDAQVIAHLQQHGRTHVADMDAGDAEEHADQLRRMWAVIEMLPDAQRELVTRVYGLGDAKPVRASQIAREEGVSRQAVSIRLKFIREKLRRAMRRIPV